MDSGDQPRSDCMYRVPMNWKLKYEPNIAIMPRLARMSEPLRRMPRRTRGCRVRRSIDTNAAINAATSRSEPMVRMLPQPAVRRLNERVHQQQRRGGAAQGAEDVVVPARFWPVIGPRDEPDASHQDRGCGGDWQQKRPVPTDLRHHTTEDQPGRESAGAEKGVDRQRPVAVRAFTEGRRDDR